MALNKNSMFDKRAKVSLEFGIFISHYERFGAIFSSGRLFFAVLSFGRSKESNISKIIFIINPMTESLPAAGRSSD
jgi:hypothetical protein